MKFVSLIVIGALLTAACSINASPLGRRSLNILKSLEDWSYPENKTVEIECLVENATSYHWYKDYVTLRNDDPSFIIIGIKLVIKKFTKNLEGYYMCQGIDGEGNTGETEAYLSFEDPCALPTETDTWCSDFDPKKCSHHIYDYPPKAENLKIEIQLDVSVKPWPGIWFYVKWTVPVQGRRNIRGWQIHIIGTSRKSLGYSQCYQINKMYDNFESSLQVVTEARAFPVPYPLSTYMVEVKSLPYPPEEYHPKFAVQKQEEIPGLCPLRNIKACCDSFTNFTLVSKESIAILNWTTHYPESLNITIDAFVITWWSNEPTINGNCNTENVVLDAAKSSYTVRHLTSKCGKNYTIELKVQYTNKAAILGCNSSQPEVVVYQVPVDGSYGDWSLNNTCNVTCGKGFERWSRKCNNPEPKYGGRNCSHLGEQVEYRLCLVKPCPVNGGYTEWKLSSPCNVSCGDGVETWRRTCHNPVPQYGGRNCSGLGISIDFRNCSKTACPKSSENGNKKQQNAAAIATVGFTIAAILGGIAIAALIYIYVKKKVKDSEEEEALGMENGKIDNTRITSSSFCTGLPPEGGRLNGASCWSASDNDKYQWIQVDLCKERVVTAIATQGRKSADEWVVSYVVSYSLDKENFKNFKTNGDIEVFSGNEDKNTVVMNVLSPPVTARYIRIHPQSWYNHISMRLELYGSTKQQISKGDVSVFILNSNHCDRCIQVVHALAALLMATGHVHCEVDMFAPLQKMSQGLAQYTQDMILKSDYVIIPWMCEINLPKKDNITCKDMNTLVFLSSLDVIHAELVRNRNKKNKYIPVCLDHCQLDVIPPTQVHLPTYNIPSRINDLVVELLGKTRLQPNSKQPLLEFDDDDYKFAKRRLVQAVNSCHKKLGVKTGSERQNETV